MINRERFVDVSKLDKTQANALAEQIGTKVREICDAAVGEANRILNVYGMESKMQFAIGKKGEFDTKEVTPKITPKVTKRKKALKSNL